MKPRLTLLLGDRNGIGPEIAAKLVSHAALREAAEVEVLGDPAVLAQGCAVAGTSHPDCVQPYCPVDGIETRPGEVTADAGAEMLACLAHAVRRVRDGHSDGVVFAPLNKQALHLGGLSHEDEMQFIAHELNYSGDYGELNVLDRLWTTRVTSHIPLRDVAAKISADGILRAIHLAHNSVQEAGVAAPRIAVAALNPHAGDGGNFGAEEIEVIAPAVARAAAQGFDVEGPYPSDTVFVRARRGDVDAVVTMYHDQGQIAMKLLGFGRGVTVMGGLPVVVTTCAHGTGYDIVGQNVATDEALRNALVLAAKMAAARHAG